ncbi:hypothetical protein ACLI4R_19020 [Natrialbaceae archaeon A-chndr2]
MGAPLYISAGDLTTDAILKAMHEGRRIVVTVETMGSEHDVTLRYDDGIYYCDTPTRLHRHDRPDEMRTCIRKMGYAAEEA